MGEAKVDAKAGIWETPRWNLKWAPRDTEVKAKADPRGTPKWKPKGAPRRCQSGS